MYIVLIGMGYYHSGYHKAAAKAIQMIYRLFLVTAMYCQASSSQFFSITQPLRSFSVLAGWEGSLGTCSR